MILKKTLTMIIIMTLILIRQEDKFKDNHGQELTVRQFRVKTVCGCTGWSDYCLYVRFLSLWYIYICRFC